MPPSLGATFLFRFPRRAKQGRRRAFSILEVMMASSIMALAIATSVTTLQRGFANLDTARNLTIAGQIIQTELEKMRMNSWATVSAYPAGPTTITVDSIYTAIPAIGNRFALTRTAVSPQTGMMQVTFQITWRNFDGRQLQRSYTTYYSQYGLYDYFYNTSS